MEDVYREQPVKAFRSEMSMVNLLNNVQVRQDATGEDRENGGGDGGSAAPSNVSPGHSSSLPPPPGLHGLLRAESGPGGRGNSQDICSQVNYLHGLRIMILCRGKEVAMLIRGTNSLWSKITP